MYVLHAENEAVLMERARLFEQYMEPLLARLEAFYNTGQVPPNLTEIPQYLQVCRWPFRKLEYSFVLDALLDCLTPNSRYLDVGSGATPLAYVFAARGVQAEASDRNERLIEALNRLGARSIYGTEVKHVVQDLTKLSYPDAAFDAISCVSVLEHIPAPHDQTAIQEMLRILKPGGILVLTVDFVPPLKSGRDNHMSYYWKRIVELAQQGNLVEIGRGAMRKLQARQAVQQGTACQARSANQCFEVDHLEQDILPFLKGEAVESRISFSTDLRSVTPDDAQRFWNFEPGLFEAQGQRAVLPAAYILRKTPVAASV